MNGCLVFVGGLITFVIAAQVVYLICKATDIVHWRGYPLLLFAAASVATVLFVRWRISALEKKTPKFNTCSTCGYDLRATESRCPECGTDVPLPLDPK